MPAPRTIDSISRLASRTAVAGSGAEQQPRHHERYLQGIDIAEIIDTVHARRAPMIPVSHSLRL